MVAKLQGLSMKHHETLKPELLIGGLEVLGVRVGVPPSAFIGAAHVPQLPFSSHDA